MKTLLTTILLLTILVPLSAQAAARHDARIVYGDDCGRFGSLVYVTNTGDERIQVTICKSWTYGIQEKESYIKKIVDPGDHVQIGCTDSSDIRVRNKDFTITGARYIRGR
jgi:hypothetical protein